MESGGGLWRFAIPFTLSILVSAGSLRWLVSGSFTRIEQVVAFSASLTCSFLALPIWIGWLRFPQEASGWVFLLVPPLTIIANVYLAIRAWTSWGARSCSPIVALR